MSVGTETVADRVPSGLGSEAAGLTSCPGPALPTGRTVASAVWLCGGILLLAAAAYGWMIPWHSLDADHWFVPWLHRIVVDGPSLSLRVPMQIDTEGASGSANYNPPYLYLLWLGSLMHGMLDELTIVKLVSIAGALFCAGCMFVLMRRFMTATRAMPFALAFLLLPTSALNAAAWGQTDAIYTGLLLLCVSAALSGRWPAMMLAFGAALAFKLPAVFIGPFLLGVVATRRVPLWTIPLPLVSYTLFLLPALIAGRPAADLARVYLDQSGTYRWLSMNVPNPWLLVQHLQLMSYPHGVVLGLMLAVAVGLAIAGVQATRKVGPAEQLLLAAAAVLAMPYVLPKMHDRYFFPADAMTYALAVALPRRWSIATTACVQLGSLGAYSSILFGIHAGAPIGALSMSVAVVIIAVMVLQLPDTNTEPDRGPVHPVHYPSADQPALRQPQTCRNGSA